MVGVKQFCVEQALERALAVFWQKGYEATSMRDLLEAMGIQKGSFYATFNSKREIYIEALKHYCLTANRALHQILVDTDQPKQALHTLLLNKVEECSAAEGTLGCMGVNAAMETAPSDPDIAELIQQFFSKQEKTLQMSITKAQRLGQTAEDIHIEGVAKAIFAILMGLSIQGRAKVSSAHQAQIVDQAMRLLKA